MESSLSRTDLTEPKSYRAIREIRELSWARFLDSPPSKHRRSKTPDWAKTGLAYEKRVGRELRTLLGPEQVLLSGKWIAFCDAHGRGLAQPDFLVVEPQRVFVFEVKLSHSLDARVQLQKLYGPLAASLFPERACALVEVVKLMRGVEPARMIYEPFEALCDGELSLWHFI